MADEVLSMIASARLIPPPEAYAARSYLSSYDEYRARYQASIDDPAAFWDEIADELVWQQRGKTVIAGELPDFQFFPGSYINVCENCVDRQAKHPMYATRWRSSSRGRTANAAA
ncbi:acetyl-coenzyme A synthetase N-terminal domain-containing protein [Alicyclobacillus acidocaldarius]|uniref:acetyl-coenzyme A synthetase N-terminal domain-containing protein n=1 Tax=Alicyclobacillus acidocaldarius TaxID=405212 RepID=UPI00019DD8E1|nr:acetyl-coenzyme A synthetase N-terminal domain-containing protein [Alicyclobacillus acidocaldarius]